MKNLVYLLVYIIACFILQLAGIWWLPAIAAIFLGYLLKDQSAMTVFALGLLGLLLLWGGWSIYSDNLNNGILSGKIGELFNGLSGLSLIAITALFGGILGGSGALTGKYLSELFSGNV